MKSDSTQLVTDVQLVSVTQVHYLPEIEKAIIDERFIRNFCSFW